MVFDEAGKVIHLQPFGGRLGGAKKWALNFYFYRLSSPCVCAGRMARQIATPSVPKHVFPLQGSAFSWSC